MKDLKKVIVDSDKNEIREMFYIARCDLKQAYQIIDKLVKENKDLVYVNNILYCLLAKSDDSVICFV